MVKQYVRIKDLEFVSHPNWSGMQAKKVFNNGFGASVITGDWRMRIDSEHPYEIGVYGRNGSLTYDTPVTSDVVGYLNETEANEILRQIQDLT